MHKNLILLSTLFAAGAASAHTTQLGASAFQPAQPGLEEAGCGAKADDKGKEASCGAKAKEGDAKSKEASCGAHKGKAKAKKAKGDKSASCGAGTCGGKAKDGKAAPKDDKGEKQASCGAKKDSKG